MARVRSMNIDELRSRVQDVLPGVRRDLEDLVRIESVSATHLAAARAFGDDLPVSLVIFIEGEEEVGSDSLVALLRQHHDELRSDVIVIADSGNWDIGVPALTTSLRGLVRADVEVRTLTHAVHSGMWGGLVPDSLMTLARLIASLHDDRGDVAIAGLHAGPAADVDY